MARDHPIEFHESEYLESPLDEDTLRILVNFLPRKVYDQLFYNRQVNHDLRLHSRHSSYHMAQRGEDHRERSDPDIICWSVICPDAAELHEKEDEKTPTLAV